MPAISRIRIVNFAYNDGKRIVPDEVFVLENDNRQCVDTLINLINGGGKTAIIQIILQNVLPKAVIQGRHIENYFNKGTDHCFVLIEWQLDNSQYKLMSGIAIAGGVNADSGNNASVRFYTFINRYYTKGDKNDILTMKLSERKNGQFRVLSFDEVRKSVKASMKYYPSDDVRKYYADLAECGILHSEWERVIRKINDNEGGVDDFFKNCRTADSLLNQFIIPGVCENKQDRADEEDGSTETMFKNYAQSYMGQSEKLALKDHSKAFVKKLSELLPKAEELWYCDDKRRKSIEAIYDYIHSARLNINSLEDESKQIAGRLEQQKSEIKKITLEEQSSDYYAYKDNFERYSETLNRLSEQISLNEAEITRCEYNNDVMQAADYYQELCKHRAKAEATKVAIREKEEESIGEGIASIKYSLYIAAEKRLKTISDEISTLNERIAENNTLISQNKNIGAELGDKIKGLKSNIDRLEGLIEERKRNIENSLKKLGLRFTRTLDGLYSADSLLRGKKELEQRYNALCYEGEVLRQGLEKNNNDSERLNDEQQANALRLHDIEIDKKSILEKIEEYNQMLSEVIKVYKQWNYDESKLFDNSLFTMLENETSRLTEQLRQNERRYEKLAEQLSYAENNRLHLSEGAVNFMAETGVDYQTGEDYLLGLDEVTRERILKNNPAVAYSVIVMGNCRGQLLSDISEELWLSALLPVYTYEDISAMAEGSFSVDDKVIAAFSTQRFKDMDGFITELRNKVTIAGQECELYKSRLADVKEQADILKDFTFGSSYYTDLQNRYAELKDEEEKTNSRNNDIDSALQTIKEEINRLNGEISSNNLQQSRAKENIVSFEMLCEKINDYYTVLDEYNQKRRQLKDSEREKENVDKVIHKLEATAAELEEDITGKAKCREECEGYLSKVSGCDKAEILAEDYDSLKLRYNEYMNSYNEDITKLQKTLDDCQDKILNVKTKISRYGFDESEYINVIYDDKRFSKNKDTANKLKVENKELTEKERESDKNVAIARDNMEKLIKSLAEFNTQPLPRSEIGCDFKARKAECEKTAAELGRKQQELYTEIKKMDRKLSSAEGFSEEHKIEDYTPKPIALASYDLESMKKAVRNNAKELTDKEKEFKSFMQKNLLSPTEKYQMFKNTYNGILEYINNTQIEGDRYFTLQDRIEKDIDNYNRNIKLLEVDLADVESSKKQLATNCYNRAKSLYKNLNSLAKKSSVKIYGTNRQMLKISLPEIEEDSNIPLINMSEYIDECVGNYIKIANEDSENGNAGDKYIYQCMESRRLLNHYINNENIPVSVFKIDSTPQNSSYRSWEKAISANSGGERFIVFFALVISMMNYSRGVVKNVKNSTGVLIMDNPFGPISSGHLLEPMFEIARHFKIQLVCFSNHDSSDILSCFENVCRIKINHNDLSSNEFVEFENGEQLEHLEHGSYRVEQISLM